MNESVGYTVTINIIITFIIIVFAFISNVLIYYKSNKVGNLITDSIEKYSGFNDLSRNEIENKLFSVGYNKTNINCPEQIDGKNNKPCTVVTPELTANNGYCVYYCIASTRVEATEETEEIPDYYYYKIKTNMIINIPIINDIVNASVFTSTGNIYNFDKVDQSIFEDSGEFSEEAKE